MQPISSLIPGAVQLPAAVGVKESPKIQKTEEGVQNRPRKPVMDEYIPEEKQKPSGLYWIGKDEKNQPKIYFDDPERAEDDAQAPEELPDSDGPEQDKNVDGPQRKGSDGKSESCTGNTDQVDREIEKLKKRQKELEQQINSETDDAKIKVLEQKLAQVNRELNQKDNDAYRCQHTVYTYS